jgi:pimeloyl-ACP methyl ester carboxylesterase
MKTVLFVPGFQEGLKDRDYTSVIRAIEQKGYTVRFVPIRWSRTTIASWVAELEEVYNNYKPEDTILAGFSYGSMTALVTASKRIPSELWLFSLSPYFSEDIPFLKPAWLRHIGKQRTERFSQVSFDEIYPKISCSVKLFAGEQEMATWPSVKQRFEKASTTFKQCTAVVVPGAGHNIEHPNYIKAILKGIA